MRERIATFENASGQWRSERNILIFGCRKEAADYYYRREWETAVESGSIRLMPAFSQEQQHKVYVQKVLREADGGMLLAKHLLERGGALYIAGGAKMARAVKDEVVEILGKVLGGGEKEARLVLKKLHKLGLFSVEAWS